MSKSIFSNDTGFARFMNMLADILIIGILWVVCSIPIITAGTATTSAYYAMAKVVRYSEGYAAKEFFHAFKMNFRQSILLTILYWIGIALTAIDIIFTWGNRSTFNDAMFIGLGLVVFVISGLAIFYCVLLSRFTKKNIDLIKTAIILMFRHIYVTIPVLLVFALSIVAIYLMPWIIFFLPGLYMFALTYPMEWILHKIMPVPEEGSPEADKWYYGSGKVMQKMDEDELSIVGRDKFSKKKEKKHDNTYRHKSFFGKK